MNKVGEFARAISRKDPAAMAVDGYTDEDSTDGADSVEVPTFDRGIFTIPVNQHKLRFALMPPYLQTLTFSKARLEAHPGWRATRRTLLEMNRVSRDNGATLVVLFIPFKSQVYLPLLERSFSRTDLENAFRFYFRHSSLPTSIWRKCLKIALPKTN
jgi:hypothetical protein